jgi:hypothetical protein
MMEEIAKFGTQLRIYADWTKPNAGGWKAYYSSMPLHPYSNTAIR